MQKKILAAMKVDAFCEELASEAPAPGGGSVSALAAALGASLAAMVARLTVGRKKYAAAEAAMKAVMESADGSRATLLRLVDDDTAAYNAVMAAHRLPKETAEERADRARAIVDATRTAIAVPLEVARQATSVLDLVLLVVGKGNVNAVSDAGVAGLLAHAAVEGALLNVRINLAGVRDPSVVDETKKVARKIHDRAEDLAAKIAAAVASRMA